MKYLFLLIMTKLSLTTQQSLSFQASVLPISTGNVLSVLDSNALTGWPTINIQCLRTCISQKGSCMRPGLHLQKQMLENNIVHLVALGSIIMFSTDIPAANYVHNKPYATPVVVKQKVQGFHHTSRNMMKMYKHLVSS